MNNQEAQFILRVYRPDGQDASDPMFAEALEQAKTDPELAHWLREERAIDAAISRKLKTVQVPSELKNTILAERRVVRPDRSWYRRTWLAAAAAVIFLLSLAGVLFSPDQDSAQFADYRQEMMATLSAGPVQFDLNTEDMNRVHEWLKENQAHEGFVVPAGLSGRSQLACRILDWRGKKVSFICFQLENRQKIHLFVVDRNVLEGGPETATPQFAQIKGMATASWAREDKTYLLAAHGDQEVLRRYL